VERGPVARRIAELANAFTLCQCGNAVMGECCRADVMFAGLKTRSVCRGNTRCRLPGGIVASVRRVSLGRSVVPLRVDPTASFAPGGRLGESRHRLWRRRKAGHYARQGDDSAEREKKCHARKS